MNPQTEDKSGSKLDTLWLALSAAVLVGAIAAFYQFQAEYSMPVRWIGLLVATGVSVVLLYQSSTGKTLWSHVQGSRIELRKTVWPTRQESMQTTLLIAAVVVVIALLLWAVDSGLLWGIKRLTGQGS